MRFFTLSTTALLAVLALSTTALAQLEAIESVSAPFERSVDSTLLTEGSLLEARQAANTTSSSNSSTATTTSAEPSGSAALGGDATITEPSCSMTNHLSQNQQASWGNGFINSCCSFNQGTACFYRRQDSVSADQECEIPSCDDLQSYDESRMVGFVPLNSTNGSGKYGNVFLSLGMLSAGGMMVPMMGAVVMVSLVVSTMVTL